VTFTDILLPYLTVRDQLVYTAKLRLSQKVSTEEKLRRVRCYIILTHTHTHALFSPRPSHLSQADDLIEELGLVKAKHTVIGSEDKKGISGGERKLLSISILAALPPPTHPTHCALLL
jgi:ABC-type multidrug transport system ATPase subunit